MESKVLAQISSGSDLTRRSLLAGFAATLATPAFASARPTPRGPGASRRFYMTSIHTGETIDVTYVRDGRYDADAIRAINTFMRDWRTGDVVEMDLDGIDLWARLHRTLGSDHPFHLISGYRSPKTNGMLASNSSGVARKSLHMRGMAADLRLPDRNLEQIAKAASAIGAGGIGIYPGSQFVHVDTGRVRRWRG